MKLVKVEKDDLMAVVMYAKVRSKMHESLNMNNVDTNQQFDIVGNPLIDRMYSADRYDDIKKVTRTEMAGILSKSYNVPFTVIFQKEGGDVRKLRGRLIEPEHLLGRCRVEDLDQPEGHRFRLVDNRTLEELIVKGVKYQLKK